MRSWVFLAFLALASALEVHISAPKTRLSNAESFDVSFSLTNNNNKAATILRWNTPLDAASPVLRANMFEIVNELGVAPLYTGIAMKRRVTASDFVTLQPGQSIKAQVNLLNGYWFPQADKYFITLKTAVSYTFEELSFETLVNQDLSSFIVEDLISSEILPVDVLDIIEPPHFLHPDIDDGLLGTVTVNANCNSTRTTTVQTADRNSQTLANQVRTYMGKTCGGGAYVTWMGACDSSRYSTVRSNFDRIASRISSGYRVDCAGPSCSANTYAYVYPSDTTYTVYVCGAFWNAASATCRTDSQPGTIVHEISHFNGVAGTSDIAYGTSACQNLANSNPSQAIRNADSHEYLSESCPTF